MLTVARPLTDSAVDQYQISASVSDNGIPSLTSQQSALITINVLRNKLDPVFLSQDYRVTIPETESIGNSILKVSAVDQDVVSLL